MSASPGEREKDMRLCHIPGAKETTATSPYVIRKLEIKHGSWRQAFGNLHLLEIEAGMGKGRSTMELAGVHLDINYIEIGRYSNVLSRGSERRLQLNLNNIYLTYVDAETMPKLFAPGEVSRTYFNFSDLWSKDRYAKRCPASSDFMAVYDKTLACNRVAEFKTDNRELFEYSLESILSVGWKILSRTFDLHNSPMAEGNITAEYETKFAAEGKPICKLVVARA